MSDSFEPYEICAGCFAKQGEIEKLKPALKKTLLALEQCWDFYPQFETKFAEEIELSGMEINDDPD